MIFLTVEWKIDCVYQNILCNILEKVTVFKVITCASQITGDSDAVSLVSDDYVSYPIMIIYWKSNLLPLEWMFLPWFIRLIRIDKMIISQTLLSH